MSMRECIKCGGLIKNRKPVAKYCSDKCSKLYLKAGWRKRTKEKRNEYNREYRKAKNGGDRPTAHRKFRDSKCLHCGGKEDLQYAHVKPLWAGGRHKWGVTFCRKHHSEFDNLLRDFWRRSVNDSTHVDL